MLALISMINMLVFRLLEALESIERLKPRLLPHIFNWEILLPRALPMEHVVNTPVYLTLAPLIVCDKGFIAFSQINLRYSKRHLGRHIHHASAQGTRSEALMLLKASNCWARI